MKLYIAILNEVPDHMVPVLVAHAVLGAHIKFTGQIQYETWRNTSFKKCVVSVNRKEFDKLVQTTICYTAYENKTLNGEISCVVVLPEDNPCNTLKFAKLWKPNKD